MRAAAARAEEAEAVGAQLSGARRAEAEAVENARKLASEAAAVEATHAAALQVRDRGLLMISASFTYDGGHSSAAGAASRARRGKGGGGALGREARRDYISEIIPPRSRPTSHLGEVDMVSRRGGLTTAGAFHRYRAELLSHSDDMQALASAKEASAESERQRDAAEGRAAEREAELAECRASYARDHSSHRISARWTYDLGEVDL